MEQRTKNIVIVSHYFPPHMGGIEMVAYQQAKRFAAMGHKVTVITSKTSGSHAEAMDGVKVIRVTALNMFEKGGIPFPLFSLRLWSVLRGAIKNADIVHIHDAFYMSSFFAALATYWQKKPIVLTQHVAMVFHPSLLVNMIQRIVYGTTGAIIFRLSDRIIVFNDRVKDFLIHRGVSKDKIADLPNGVDTDLFHSVSATEKTAIRKRYGLSPDKKIILFVGRFVPKKGIDKVLAIRDEAYQIVCVGGTPPKEQFDNVLFFGELDQKELAQFYQAADIFLLPSRSEGFPLSIQEAMASGLPIVTSYDKGYERYGFDKDLIRLLDDVEEKSLRKTIQQLIRKGDLAAMGRYSRTYAQDHFDWSLVMSQLDALYNALLFKQKIAIISDAVYPFHKGGKEKRLYDITTRLAAQGYDVTIYCMQWWKGGKTLVQDGVTLHAVSPYYPLYAGNRRSIKEAIFFALYCFKLLGQKFDVIEVDHMPHLVLYTLKIVCLLKRKRMIAVWHEVWGSEYWREYLGLAGILAYWIEKVSAKLPDTIIAVSQHTANDLRNILHTEREITVIPNGIDIETILKSAPAAHGADIVFVGRLLVHKNVDVLLSAIKILTLKDPGISAVIIGDGPEREHLARLANELGVQKNVSFLHTLKDEHELYPIIQASKVFVLPSTREGFGITVLEANACGLPVVTIDHEQNAAKDLIVNNENGILSLLDELDLAVAIKRAMNMKKSAAQYRKYAAKYDWAGIVPTLRSFYAQ